MAGVIDLWENLTWDTETDPVICHFRGSSRKAWRMRDAFLPCRLGTVGFVIGWGKQIPTWNSTKLLSSEKHWPESEGPTGSVLMPESWLREHAGEVG